MVIEVWKYFLGSLLGWDMNKSCINVYFVFFMMCKCHFYCASNGRHSIPLQVLQTLMWRHDLAVILRWFYCYDAIVISIWCQQSASLASTSRNYKWHEYSVMIMSWFVSDVLHTRSGTFCIPLLVLVLLTLYNLMT